MTSWMWPWTWRWAGRVSIASAVRPPLTPNLNPTWPTTTSFRLPSQPPKRGTQPGKAQTTSSKKYRVLYLPFDVKSPFWGRMGLLLEYMAQTPFSVLFFPCTFRNWIRKGVDVEFDCGVKRWRITGAIEWIRCRCKTPRLRGSKVENTDWKITAVKVCQTTLPDARRRVDKGYRNRKNSPNWLSDLPRKYCGKIKTLRVEFLKLGRWHFS